jgi:hypothetical protein
LALPGHIIKKGVGTAALPEHQDSASLWITESTVPNEIISQVNDEPYYQL